MATFIGIHKFDAGIGDETIRGKWSKYKDSCAKLSLKPVNLYLNGDQGAAFCITEASNGEEVRKAHEDAGLTVDEVIEVRVSE
ncbi:DUF4242 domain-containing protein [Candidatus Curtissbacteria bacterium]|nr:DUF4242 domain-containing protein [Candidatus Curtissbacteria bacterium]